MLFLNLMKQNPLPVDAKFVAHRIEIRCPCFFKTMGNVFQKDGQCFLKRSAMEFVSKRTLGHSIFIITHTSIYMCVRMMIKNSIAYPISSSFILNMLRR